VDGARIDLLSRHGAAIEARVLLLFCLLTLAFPAFGAGGGKVNLLTSQDPRGVVTFEVDIPIVQSSPQWDGKGEPPLSVAQAILKAEAWLREAHADLRGIPIQSYAIALNRVPRSANLPNRWIYRIEFVPAGMVASTVARPITVVLLLDGTVVPPSLAIK
jgi:hypothetical protein